MGLLCYAHSAYTQSDGSMWMKEQQWFLLLWSRRLVKCLFIFILCVSILCTLFRLPLLFITLSLYSTPFSFLSPFPFLSLSCSSSSSVCVCVCVSQELDGCLAINPCRLIKGTFVKLNSALANEIVHIWTILYFLYYMHRPIGHMIQLYCKVPLLPQHSTQRWYQCSPTP